ncbi:hypothetical protein GGTG_02897 [Gaeumannomyces tritici R3-111a-1]|uniref:Peptidase M43 pregnancy-associated plasma-A domain-containing protein n=1 Tax=Gaeumannomyces tritici (strain R3-111a-1) TaxID=644352 RepID=J3NNP0_GAET3|nr:hypothetical protein GGTG_02897 [Gaeumannomyces tritici R3-111a-1]EJT77792.1 hypothetical protein GGTG_02897 [Gaeumannomyces tritici R3-111a-1]
MHLPSFAALSLAATGSLKAGRGLGSEFRCGTPPLSPAQLQAFQQLAAGDAAAAAASPVGLMGATAARAVVNITLHYHIVSSDKTEAGGNTPASRVEKQMSVLNSIFPRYGFAFNLGSVTRTVNAKWAQLELFADAVEMKRALRRGSYADLNMYTISLGDGLLGVAAPPLHEPPARDSADFIWDGVIITRESQPGGALAEYNLGYAAVHEIGHWLGLLHTFTGGCEETDGGDLVADTPAEATPASGCPVGRNTCPKRPGVDPIHNYMDYSVDSCLNEFTPGQAVRMRSSWDKFRAGK